MGFPVNHGPFANALITGLPLRDDIASVLAAHHSSDEGTWIQLRAKAKRDLGIHSENKVVLVFGGSQGSQAINGVIEDTRDLIREKPITIVHSVGSGNDLPASDDKYIAFSYIENMATAYLASDLVIARSGAITCSEVSALGKYALFIPLPIGNGEQSVNADHLVEMGVHAFSNKVRSLQPGLSIILILCWHSVINSAIFLILLISRPLRRF